MTDATPLPGQSRVPELAPLVRSVIRRRVTDPSCAEDLAQETLERLTAAEGRIEPGALAPYAVVSARNAVRGWSRRQERELRHGPRMLDLGQADDPEEKALQAEERRAVVAALERLPTEERRYLLAHEVDGVETKALADDLGTTPGAVAVRLSRTRARLRVEYLLALRRVDPPTTECRRVLLAISGGDKRQQRTARAGEHLLSCGSCAGLSDALVRRHRPLAALWPFLGLDHLVRWLRRTARGHPAATAAAGVATVAAVMAAVVALPGSDSSPPVLFVEVPNSVVPLSGTQPMAPYAGMTVEARGVQVQSAVGSAGFWAGESRAKRVWVDVDDRDVLGRLAPGQHISFRGTVEENTSATLDRAGDGDPADRAQLEREGYHVDADAATIAPAGQPPR